MATSGTAVFNLDLIDIIEEAYEQAGSESRTGYDIRTARRSLNLLALDWANRGYNLWTVEEEEIPLLTGVEAYDLPTDTIDVAEMVIRQSTGGTNYDIAVTRIGMAVYATIPTKETRGRPVQVWVDRQIAPRIVVWPVPQDDTYTFKYWRMRRIQDSGTSGQLTFDIPDRFLPCLVSGLAYKIAQKKPELFSRLEMLKNSYEEAWQLASTEDREKTTLRMVPERMYM